MRLLALARAVSAEAPERAWSRERLVALFERLAQEHGPEAPLSRALVKAWPRTRGDHALALALAWAREQLRLALRDVLEAGVQAGVVRSDAPVDALAWVTLAACEALARDPAGADRLAWLIDVMLTPGRTLT